MSEQSRLVISAWSAVSPYGIGAARFADGAARGPAEPLPPASELPAAELAAGLGAGEFPAGPAYPVPGFDIRGVLGAKGTRSMNRLSALTITAARELLDSAGWLAPGNGDAAGLSLVLGTTAGSAQSMADLTRDMLVNARPFFVDPSRIPAAVMNGASAHCAIWHRLRGPNATVGGGRTAGLLALRYAARLLDSGRAPAVLCGGAEELTPVRAWLEHHGREQGARNTPLAEGAALLLLEPADRAGRAGTPVLADLLAVEVGVYPDGDPGPALAACLTRALDRAGVREGEVWALSTTGTGGPLCAAEREVTDRLLGGHQARSVPSRPSWGDAGSAAAPFQLAAVLSAATGDPRARGGVAVVTSVDCDGVLGCAVLRTTGAENPAAAAQSQAGAAVVATGDACGVGSRVGAGKIAAGAELAGVGPEGVRR